MKKKLLFLVSILVVVVILLLLADLSEIVEVIKMINPWIIISSCVLQIITIILINYQWQKIALQLEEKISFFSLLKINMLGTFMESITPAVKTGGEALKVYLLKEDLNLSLGKATLLVTIQKIFSLSSFLCINLMSLTLLFLTVDLALLPVGILILSTFFLFVFTLLLGLFLFFPEKTKRLIYVLPISHKKKESFTFFIKDFKEHGEVFLKKKGKNLSLIVLSFAIWFLFAIKAFIIAYGLQVDIGFWTIAVITFITYMVAMVPLLPGGLGTFEGSMVFLLIPLGVSLEKALVLTIAIRFVTFWFVFILSFLYLSYINLTSNKIKIYNN